MKNIKKTLLVSAGAALVGIAATHIYPENPDPSHMAFFGQLGRDSLVVTNFPSSSGLDTNAVQFVLDENLRTNGIARVQKDYAGNQTMFTIGSRGSSDTQQPNSFGHGNQVTVVGAYGYAQGYRSYAAGQYSHAEGNNSTARGQYSHAEGANGEAVGRASHVSGTKAMTGASSSSGHDYAYAWNGDNSISGYYKSHGVGTYNINPVGGFSGFYIGSTNLAQYVASFGFLTASDVMHLRSIYDNICHATTGSWTIDDFPEGVTDIQTPVWDSSNSRWTLVYSVNGTVVNGWNSNYPESATEISHPVMNGPMRIGYIHYLKNGNAATSGQPFVTLDIVKSIETNTYTKAQVDAKTDFSTNNTELVSTITNLVPTKAKGISIHDPTLNCDWYLTADDGTFTWYIED